MKKSSSASSSDVVFLKVKKENPHGKKRKRDPDSAGNRLGKRQCSHFTKSMEMELKNAARDATDGNKFLMDFYLEKALKSAQKVNKNNNEFASRVTAIRNSLNNKVDYFTKNIEKE